MNQKLNSVRRNIQASREVMLLTEAEIRRQISHDEDCSAAAERVLRMHTEMRGLIRQRDALGGVETIERPHVQYKRYDAANKVTRGFANGTDRRAAG